VILVGGPLLWAWAGDFDLDQRTDLVLLKLSKPTLAAQLSILREGRAHAEALFYPGQPDGSLPASPTGTRSVDLPIRIGLTNEVREAELPSLLVPVPGPALFLALDDGSLQVLPLTQDGAPRVLGRLPPGRAPEPFTALALKDGRQIFRWQTATDARIYAAGRF
jgi:hypothetical protein